MTDSDALGFFQKLADILLKPKEFFSGVGRGTKPVSALKFFLIAAVATTLLSGLLSFLGMSVAPIPGKVVSTVPVSAAFGMDRILELALSFAVLFVLSAVSQAVGRIFFKAEGNYYDTLRVFSYYQAAAMAVQFIGTAVVTLALTLSLSGVGQAILNYIYFGLLLYRLVTGLYLLYVLSVGLSVVHGISMLKAFIMGIPWIVFLVLSVAAAGAAYLWIIQVQSLMADAVVTGDFDQSMKAQATQFCIETVWNESTAIKFTMRNCGSYDVTQTDFAQTGYYIDNTKTQCTPDAVTDFKVYDTRTITCPPGSYGACTYSGCPKKTIQVVTPFGRKDTVAYQYAAGN